MFDILSKFKLQLHIKKNHANVFLKFFGLTFMKLLRNIVLNFKSFFLSEKAYIEKSSKKKKYKFLKNVQGYNYELSQKESKFNENVNIYVKC